MYDPVNHIVEMVELTDKALREVKFGTSTIACVGELHPDGMRIRRLRHAEKLLRENADAIAQHIAANTAMVPANEVAA